MLIYWVKNHINIFLVPRNMYTYTKGFDIKKVNSVKTKFTIKDIIYICEQMSIVLGDGWKIIPEPASAEGGLLFQNEKYCGYKTLRFRNNKSRWLCIDNDTLEKWNKMEDLHNTIVVEGSGIDKYRISTWLVAINGAPCWTKEQLFNLEVILNNLGFIRIGDYPNCLNIEYK